MTGVRDVRMIQQAAEQRWPITPKYRNAIVNRLMKVIVDPAASDRAVTSATRALIAMDVVNLKHEQNIKLHTDRNRFLEVAERLGIGDAVRRISEDGADSDSSCVDGARVDGEGEGRGT